MNENQTVGIVLAGGQSRRFGSPKSFAEKDGKSFYQWSIDTLVPVVNSIVLITNRELEKKFIDRGKVAVYTDIEQHSGKGPLAGIYTAMTKKPATWYAVIPTDVPFMDKKVFERLWKDRETGKQAIIPIVNGRLQPLIGYFHVSLKPIIEKLLEADRLNMVALLDEAQVTYVQFEDETPFININRLEDYERYFSTD